MSNWLTAVIAVVATSGVFLTPVAVDKAGLVKWDRGHGRTTLDYEYGYKNGQTDLQREAMDAGVLKWKDGGLVWMKSHDGCE